MRRRRCASSVARSKLRARERRRRAEEGASRGEAIHCRDHVIERARPAPRVGLRLAAFEAQDGDDVSHPSQSRNVRVVEKRAIGEQEEQDLAPPLELIEKVRPEQGLATGDQHDRDAEVLCFFEPRRCLLWGEFGPILLVQDLGVAPAAAQVAVSGHAVDDERRHVRAALGRRESAEHRLALPPQQAGGAEREAWAAARDPQRGAQDISERSFESDGRFVSSHDPFPARMCGRL